MALINIRRTASNRALEAESHLRTISGVTTVYFCVAVAAGTVPGESGDQRGIHHFCWHLTVLL